MSSPRSTDHSPRPSATGAARATELQATGESSHRSTATKEIPHSASLRTRSENNDLSKAIVDYRMNVHVFGNSPSPAVAIHGLHKSVQGNEFHVDPDVQHFVLHDFYVDDGLKSLPTVQAAISLLKRTQDVLSKSNLRLHKIAANNNEVMDAFPSSDHASDLKDLDLDADELPLQRSLGLDWNLKTDCFLFNVSSAAKPYTRRGVLSTINSLYDPLGFVAPVTVQGKAILRELTAENGDWDAPLPSAMEDAWTSWRASLSELAELPIPRRYTEASPSAAVQSEPRCDQTEFLHHNGTCVACPVCQPGEQLSGDCGFGDGGDGVCIPCEEGTFSTDTGVDPCRRCTQCNLLNRLVLTACSPTSNAVCGQCLPGHYELKSMTGEVELLCIPCDDAVREGCLPFSSRGSKTESAIMLPVGKSEEPAEKGTKAESLSVFLIGAAISSLFFLLSLLLWVVLLTVKRFKRVPEHRLKPEGLLSAANLQYQSPSGHTERATPQSESASESSSPEDTTRGQNSQNHESELHPTSIVINVTTNIKPCSQKQDNIVQEGQKGFTTDEMEQKLQTIWELAQGQSIETLNYDTIQDLSLLLDSPNHIYVLRKLGLSLGVPPKLTAHFHSFQDLFQYLRTSTYTQLPQLAQAAALLPNFEVVSRIHRALVNK